MRGEKPVWIPHPPRTEGCCGNLRVSCSLGLWKRQIFFGRRNGVALSTRKTIFLVPFGEGGDKARKKGKLNPHVLSLLEGPDSKPEMKLYLRSWRPPPRGPFQPACPQEARNLTRENPTDRPQFHKGLCLRGKGSHASPWAGETKE